jgi:hypothetical protein
VDEQARQSVVFSGRGERTDRAGLMGADSAEVMAIAVSIC